MPTFAIDASSANKPQKTGVEWYAFHLIQALKQQPLNPEERVLLFSPTPLEGVLAELPAQWESRVLNWPPKRGWMQGRVTWELWRRPVDVFFVPSQGLPWKGGSRATVTTIHDIGFRRFPALYFGAVRRTLESVTRRAVRRATTLFTVSEFTKNELVDVYRVDPLRIVVTPNAVESMPVVSFEERERVLSKYRVGVQYFLSIGRLESKKNIATLVRAFEQFKSSRGAGDPFELVLVGAPGFGYNQLKRWIEASGVRSQIRELGYLPSAETAALLSGATAYVFPSWYEGFGIPNLEAQIAGVPLVTSDIPAHREVAGEAALFVPPGEPDLWARALRRIVEESGVREQLVAAGRENAKRYSWEGTAKTVLDTFRRLV